MFRYLPHEQIDKRAWDACVSNAIQSELYAYSWYLDVVSPRWNAFVSSAAGGYQAVMPLPTLKRYGICYVSQPLFAQQLGVFSTVAISPQAWQALWAMLDEHYSLVAHYQFNTANTAEMPLSLLPSGWAVKALHTHYLPLYQPYQQLWANYTPDRKTNLKRAYQQNLRVVESTDLAPLIAMFDQSVSHKIGIHPKSYTWLTSLHEALAQRQKVRLLYTQHPNGKLGSGVMLAFHQHKIIYLFNAAYPWARASNGRTLLLDRTFKEYAQSPLVFDFESPELPNISHFYQSFGSTPQTIRQISYNHLPAWLKILQKIRRSFINSHIM